MPYQARHSK
jgi:hypothetical protein